MASEMGYYRKWKPSPHQQHVNMYGKPKRAHATREDAESALVEMTYKTGFSFKVYRCKQCKQFHIGKELQG